MPVGKALVLTALLLILLPPPGLMGSLPTPLPHRTVPDPDPSQAAAPSRPGQDPRALVQTIHGQVKPGDTISAILDPFLPLKTVYALNQESQRVLEQIRPGQPYRIQVKAGRLFSFEYEIDNKDRLIIDRQGETFSVRRGSLPVTVVLAPVSGVIFTTVFEAIRKAGESPDLAARLVSIFARDIDFIRDIQPQDRFSILVEKTFRKDRFLSYGKIQAAKVTSRGRTFHAFLHESANGQSAYYDERGKALGKGFLKAPLKVFRISSKFKAQRFHPVLKDLRSHPGVDYAAPLGTPVSTVGDGIVTALGTSRTMGNHVMIRHHNGYTTRYFHLSRFEKGMALGQKVRQGQVIGFVGQTGYATGPHLCFRLAKDGRPLDPLTTKYPSAAPVSPQEMDRFRSRVERLETLLGTSQRVAAARAPTD